MGDNGFAESSRSTGGAPRARSVPGLNQAFQRMLDHVPGAWFFVRRDGTFAYVNEGACRGLGYTREELLASTLFDVDATLTLEQWNMLWETTPPEHAQTVRTTHRRKDGSEFPVEVRAARVYIEGEDLAASYTVDLTESVQTELVNRRLLTAIGQARDAVVVTDAAGVVEYVNPAYETSTGLRKADVRGCRWSSLEVREADAFLSEFERVLADGTSWEGHVQSVRAADGERYDEEVSVSPIRSHDGKLAGCVAVKRDITQQLRIEEQLRRAQKVEAVGLLARGIAHDFNNLLQVIQGQTSLLGARVADQAAAPMLREIEGAVERASNLVRQLMTFSRRGTVEFSTLRLDTLVSDLHGMMKRLLGEHIELEWRCCLPPVWVRGNAAQLEQMVVNLCINARDAMPDGGCLQLELRQAGADELPSDARGRLAGPIFVLVVTDEGCGMSEDVQRRLFEPFFTTKEPGQGTGLGLATVQEVVKSHGGLLDMRSTPGRGSSFRVFLPGSDAGAVMDASSGRSRRVEGRGRLALVAEDERAVRMLTVRYLEQAGFRVLAAADGIDAENQVGRAGDAPSIAVLDAVMPRRGGRALFDAMRQRGWTCPVIFVTGYDYESLVETAGTADVAIVQKPFTEDQLLEEVANLLAGVA